MAWVRRFRTQIERVMASLDAPPVPIDIGASYSTPSIWRPIARHSIYVGFDPDLRELREVSGGVFLKGFIIDQAVTPEPGVDELSFQLTRSPACSSVLPPDRQALSSYLFADLFDVEREVRVKATTLDEALQRLSLSTADWVKTDTQGTDLRLFMSLGFDVRSKVLALDIEPGLIQAYRGEDLFADAHRQLMLEGFWLSDLHVGEAVRMRPETLDWLGGFESKTSRDALQASMRRSPGWVEARYLRSLEWLRIREPTERELGLLWIFAVLDGQLGYALDIAREYEGTFGAGQVAAAMKSVHPASGLSPAARIALSARRLAPAPVRQALRRLT